MSLHQTDNEKEPTPYRPDFLSRGDRVTDPGEARRRARKAASPSTRAYLCPRSVSVNRLFANLFHRLQKRPKNAIYGMLTG